MCRCDRKLGGTKGLILIIGHGRPLWEVYIKLKSEYTKKPTWWRTECDMVLEKQQVSKWKIPK